MDDLISRLDAINALEKEKPTPFVNEDGSIDPFGAGQRNQWYRDGLAIMNLSPTQQKPLKYSGTSICCYCETTNCNGCLYEPMAERREEE